jgi:hypothetical protein
MELNMILEIVASVIVSFLGRGAIIIILSDKIGQLWADKIIPKNLKNTKLT